MTRPGGTELSARVRAGVAGVLLRAGVTLPARTGRGRLTIATFHRVLPEALLAEYPLPHLAVSEGEFERLLAFFTRHYTCGPLSEVHPRWTLGEDPARPFLALTFDDGQRDNFEFARPLLARAGVAGTFFVPVEAVSSGGLLWHDRMAYAATRLLRSSPDRATALLGIEPSPAPDERAAVHAAVRRAKQLHDAERMALVARVEEAAGGPVRPSWDGMMGWDDVARLARDGHEVGSHSVTHPILPLLDDPALEAEVSGSRERLTATLGRACESFCYPNGSQDARVAEAVRRAGYLRAVTTAPGPNAAGQDPFQLSRCELLGRHARTDGLVAYRLSSLSARARV